MSSEIEARLQSLGIVLPPVVKPAANYVPDVISGKLVFVAGQVPMTPDGLQYIGKLGRDYSIEEGQKAARICGINILANLNDALGGLDNLGRMVKLTGFVNADPEFVKPQDVVNGASDVLIEVLGDIGRHARSAIGVATLPHGVAVEVEAIAEIA
jgi:enamine deaminase RidA (YjgF/YER057c/UK114 family)